MGWVPNGPSEVEEVLTLRCPSCGGFVQDGAMFCTACGAQTAPGPQGQWGAPLPPPPAQGMPLPQPYPYQPPPKDDSGTFVKVIVIVVVVVVLLAIMFAIIWMGILGAIDDIPDERLTLNLAAPAVTQREIANVTIWDLTIEVNLVTPRDTMVLWAGVEIFIFSREGVDLQTGMPLVPDDPSNYDDATNGWIDVEGWYIETSLDLFIDEGEAIKVTGMDDRYEGSTLEIVSMGDVVGTIRLPTDFP